MTWSEILFFLCEQLGRPYAFPERSWVRWHLEKTYDGPTIYLVARDIEATSDLKYWTCRPEISRRWQMFDPSPERFARGMRWIESSFGISLPDRVPWSPRLNRVQFHRLMDLMTVNWPLGPIEMDPREVGFWTHDRGLFKNISRSFRSCMLAQQFSIVDGGHQ